MEDDEVAKGKMVVESLVRECAAQLGISVDGLEWGPDADWVRRGRYALACRVNRRRTVGEFSREDMSDAPSSPDVRRRLAQHISAWFEGTGKARSIGFRPSS